MTNDELILVLTEKFPDAAIAQGNQYVEMTVAAESLHETAQLLKETETFSFDYLFCLTGVDYPENMGTIYHLESVKHRHVLVLKVRTADRVNPAIDTLSDIWITAKYHEREAYDLLGIHFNNHTDLRRLFLEDGWGFPLRKDYVDEVRIVER
ncbi:MAG TPA: NADH-quinone oxidoreductase subunit C [Prolixibacteraceae bacterium]|nr:NADH-quinone oxidoreductase subunit C [Prolixibacteraceae bacterium]